MQDLPFIFGKYAFFDEVDSIKCYKIDEVKNAFTDLEKAREKFFCVGYVSFECMGAFLESSFLDSSIESNLPILEFKIFKTRKNANKIIKKFTLDSSLFFYPDIKQNLDFKRYKNDFKTIKYHIKKGNTYQVNYTNELIFKSNCKSSFIFKTLLKNQDTKFKAFMPFLDREILSFSPELFFKINKNNITLQPMKGTIKRAKNNKLDSSLKNFLRNDLKSKSENLMIVDLLRNDISKIIKIHSLKIKNLLKIITLKTLHQMVSTIKATLQDDINLFAVFSALFPCGSISGAPKIKTLEIIKQLELRNRGVYCGALGMLDSSKAIFSVPIRTIVKEDGFFKYGVGSGIVYESKLKDEFRELNLKTSFLFNDFNLIETILCKDNKAYFLKEHLERLNNSAKKVNFNQYKIEVLLNNLDSIEQDISFDIDSFILESNIKPIKLPKILTTNKKGFYILRLILNKNGDLKKEILDFNPTSNKIHLSKDYINLNSDLMNIKTDKRDRFKHLDSSFFDTIYCTRDNILLEGSRSNIVILKNKEFLTPKSEFILNGIMRQFLLDSKIIKEAVLTKQDLLESKQIYCINSVRGVKRVYIESSEK